VEEEDEDEGTLLLTVPTASPPLSTTKPAGVPEVLKARL
jgi:hypothetical protein